jgi:hypothetical protein
LVIISNLVKRDVLALARCGPGLGEGKKETLGFAVRLSLFKTREAPTFVTKARCVFYSHVSYYASKGGHTFLSAHRHLVTKVGASPFIRKGRRALLWHISVWSPPYKKARTN